MSSVPSIVKFWKLRLDKGLPLEPYQRLAVDNGVQLRVVPFGSRGFPMTRMKVTIVGSYVTDHGDYEALGACAEAFASTGMSNGAVRRAEKLIAPILTPERQ